MNHEHSVGKNILVSSIIRKFKNCYFVVPEWHGNTEKGLILWSYSNEKISVVGPEGVIEVYPSIAAEVRLYRGYRVTLTYISSTKDF